MNKLLKTLLAFIVILGFILPTVTPTTEAKELWGKVEIKKGLIGKVVILKDTSLFYKDSKGKLTKGKTIKKNSELGVFSYDKKALLYKVEKGYIKKNSAVKYSVLPKDYNHSISKIGFVTDNSGIDDKSFNQLTWEGLHLFSKKNEAKVKYIQPESYREYEMNLLKLTKEGYGLIFGTGFHLAEPINQVASKNKNTKYAIVDDVVNQPNVASILFKENESAFLAGVVAGLKTKTNKVGFIGGLDVPLVNKYEVGFVAGVKAVNPKVETEIKYVGDFNKPEIGMLLASQMYSSNTDIIYQVAGGSGLGVFAEARQRMKKDPNKQVWVIGVDRDHSEHGLDITLTSSIKRMDSAAYDIASRAKKGNFPGGKTIVYGIAENGVDVVKTNLDSETIKRVEEFKKKVASGKIKVPTER
ncbi:BMP family ABC transporter substrate-binding protein [Bacillus sp. 31A1R]|uniref:BMP family ABC transporter substrate-binding protein n=1 Tax=Robertmurraya mangrovi TaxID=3098077 RepID=A0ABU5IXN0_9BACI|nr:BMP family ABC transporter substrate-binding protein [Bacillus sp. 31A1R]MDZ5471882.1 BMP family ABC transporter substrate-binding protein [Bacillus sp. 31A1R]